jgi:Asp-tRNA(Asn)/Glu-tRNA(Gln) amidotransferase A subunit family amidase
MELCDHTALELTKMLRKKEVSAVEILQSSLDRITKVDGRPGSLNNTVN